MPARPIKETGGGPSPGAGDTTTNWNPLSWISNAFQGWFGSLGGDIASGLEGGFVGILKDMFVVVLPWLEISIGVIIAFWALAIYFNQGGSMILNIARMAAL